MKCIKCSYSNLSDCKFCVNCGAEILLACRGCGKPISVKSKFCENCGEPASNHTQHTKLNYSDGSSSLINENNLEATKKQLQDSKSNKSWRVFSVILIAVLAVAFSLVNFYPPYKNYISGIVDRYIYDGVVEDSIKIAPTPTPSTDFKNKYYSISAQIELAIPHIRSMLEGARVNDLNQISSALYDLGNINLPVRGDRELARALNDEGLAALKANNINDAIDKFRNGVQADQGDQEIVNNLGYALIKDNQYDQAIYALMNTLTLAPTRSSAWANLGYAYAKLGKEDDSVSAYLLTYRFSQNQQKTQEFLRTQSNEDEDEKVRSASYRALVIIMKSEISSM